MRKIKFRGKVKMSIEELNDLGIPHENGWIYGAYVHNDGRPYIISHEIAEVCDEYIHPAWWCPVIPRTVGQNTGLTDKYGEEIYEGDICRDPDGDSLKVVWNNGASSFELKNNTSCFLFVMRYVDMFEVIGNTHDNPELLGVGAK